VVPNPGSETVVLSLLLRGGAALDPPDQAGLTALTTAVAQRGTVDESYDVIYNRLDSLGGSFAMQCGGENVAAHVTCLSCHLPVLARLLADVLRRPSVSEDEIERARGEILTAIRQREDAPHAVAAIELGRLVYPDGHPYRHPVSGYSDTVGAFTRDGLVDAYKAAFRPDGLIAACVGDVEADDALDLLADVLGDWENPPSPPADPALATSHPTGIQRSVVDMPDKSQADIALGFKGIPRTHPDFFALSEGTQILGGMGLMGRIGDAVRERQGLAYYASAHLGEGRGDALWSVNAGVNPANVDKALGSIVDEIRRMQDEPVTEQELADVHSYLIGALPLRLETNERLAAVLLAMAYFGLGDDYIERYPDLVRSVTRQAIQGAAQTHLTVDAYSLAIAGPQPKSATTDG
jgi:zinc protease